MASRARLGASFPLGRKKVFLPTMTMALLRATPSPFIAKFRVPLDCNKFDVRDYLLHMYGLRSVRVMTQINLQPLRRAQQMLHGTPESKLPPGRWVRPKSLKTALVELEEPFIYPPAPSDPEAYGKHLFDARQASGFDVSPAFKTTSGRGQWMKNNQRALARWSKKETSKA